MYDGTNNTAPALTDAQTTAIDFGTATVGTDITRTFALENTGTADLTISGITATPATDFTVNSSITTVPAGTTETFTVTLSGATAGAFTATLSIASNDADENPFTFDLTGIIEGAVAVVVITNPDNSQNTVLISGNNISLGQTSLNTNIQKVFGIENLSPTQAIDVNSITVDNPVFKIIDQPASIPANGFAPFTIELTATNIGSYTSSVNVETSINSFSFTVSGEVIATTPPELNIYNVLTPNGDGIHDTFKIGNIEYYPDNEVIIYNRWGDKVFEASGYNNQDVVFAGTDKVGTGNTLGSGNYYYSINKGDGTKPLTGFIFLKQ